MTNRERQQLDSMPTENQQDYDQLLESSSTTIDNQRKVVALLQSRQGEEREEREKLEAQLAELQAQLAELQAQLATLAAVREELAQLKKEAAFAAAEVHREGRSIELEKVSGQQELSDARGEIADAKATILNQSNKIRELERGFSFKPNPKESALRLEIGNLQAELSDLKQNSATAGKDFPDAADLLNQLKKAKGKKSSVTLADVEKILEILGGDDD